MTEIKQILKKKNNYKQNDDKELIIRKNNFVALTQRASPN